MCTPPCYRRKGSDERLGRLDSCHALMSPGLKVLVVPDVSPLAVTSGGQRVLREQAYGLAKLAHEVGILSRFPGDDLPLLSLAAVVSMQGSEFRWPAFIATGGTLHFALLVSAFTPTHTPDIRLRGLFCAACMVFLLTFPVRRLCVGRIARGGRGKAGA